MNDGHIEYAERQGHWIFRLQGDIRYTMAYPFDAFLDHLFNGPPPKSLCLDLNNTTSIDSTGIGLVAKCAIRLQQTAQKKPVIFCCNEEVIELLNAVNLPQFCSIVRSSATHTEAHLLPSTQPEEKELARTILEAHRLLCDLSDSNRKEFQSVVDALQQSITS